MSFDSDLEPFQTLKSLIKDQDLLIEACTHKSFNPRGRHYERLEHVGDAVIDAILSSYFFVKYPNIDEGKLTTIRASLVNEGSLAVCARSIGLGHVLILGVGEEKTLGREKNRILASSFEAVVGALMLDRGWEIAYKWLLFVMKDLMPEDVENWTPESFDPKTSLQEKLHIVGKESPVYECVSETGPAHNPLFKMAVLVDGVVLGEAEGKSKRKAEQEAAKTALVKIEGGFL